MQAEWSLNNYSVVGYIEHIYSPGLQGFPFSLLVLIFLDKMWYCNQFIEQVNSGMKFMAFLIEPTCFFHQSEFFWQWLHGSFPWHSFSLKCILKFSWFPPANQIFFLFFLSKISSCQSSSFPHRTLFFFFFFPLFVFVKPVVLLKDCKACQLL